MRYRPVNREMERGRGLRTETSHQTSQELFPRRRSEELDRLFSLRAGIKADADKVEEARLYVFLASGMVVMGGAFGLFA